MDFMLRVLGPSSKLCDKIEIVLDSDDTMYAITKMESGTHKSQITLYVETRVEYVSGVPSEPVHLNIGDSRKIMSALNQITDDVVEFEYDGSALMYDSPAMSFRFGLLVDEAMTKKTVAKNRIKSFVPKTYFDVESEILKKLLSITSCMPTYDKMYLTCGSHGVKCLHTDKEQGATDKVEMVLTDTFFGEPIDSLDSVIVTEEVFKFVSMNKFDVCRVEIVDPGIVIFKLNIGSSLLEYIVPKRLK